MQSLKKSDRDRVLWIPLPTRVGLCLKIDLLGLPVGIMGHRHLPSEFLLLAKNRLYFDVVLVDHAVCTGEACTLMLQVTCTVHVSYTHAFIRSFCQET